MTHASCGGVLVGEGHRRWALSRERGTQVGPILTREVELLHRCQTCGMIGVAVLADVSTPLLRRPGPRND